jgi:hypothetical protein
MHAIHYVSDTCVYRKSIRIDLVMKSANVSDDGRADMLLACAVHLAVQVEEPA